MRRQVLILLHGAPSSVLVLGEQCKKKGRQRRRCFFCCQWTSLRTALDRALKFNQLFGRPRLIPLFFFPWVTRNPLSHTHLSALQLSVLPICNRKTCTRGFRCCLIPKWKNNRRNQVAIFKFYAHSLGSRCKEFHMFMFIGAYGQVNLVSHLTMRFRFS